MMEECCGIWGTVIPGEDFVQPKIPVYSPENNVGEYIESKLEDSKLCVYPNWDCLYPEPAQNLTKIRREINNKNNQLHNKRQQYLKVRVALDSEWKILREKEETLKKSFILFHEFVKENKEKRERGKRRIIEEVKVLKRKDDQIKAMETTIEKMSNVRTNLENSAKKLKIFEDYLAEVCTASGEYKAIANVLIRFDSLTNARNDLACKQKESLECLEKQRLQMLKFTEDRASIIMGLHNHLAGLKSRYEETLNLARYWETVFYKTKNKCKKELVKIEIVKSSTRNIYEQMCKKKGVPIEFDVENVENMLHYIKVTIKEYKKITKIALKTVAINNSIALASEM